MKLDLTRQTLLQAIIFSLLTITCYYGVRFAMQSTADLSVDHFGGVTYIGKEISTLLNNSPLLYKSVKLISLIFNVLFVSRIFIRNVIHIRTTHIASLVYVVALLGMSTKNWDITPILATTLLFFGVENSFRIKKLTNSSRYFFLGSFFFSLASLIYWPAIIGIAIPITRTFIFQRFYDRELLASFFGIIAPMFFLSYYYWVFNNDFLFPIVNWSSNIAADFSPITIDSIQSINIFSLSLILTFIYLSTSTILIYLESEEKRIRIRNSIIIFLTQFVIYLILIMLFNSIVDNFLPIICIPIAIITALYFNLNTNYNMSNIIFILIISISLINIILFRNIITIKEIINLF